MMPSRGAQLSSRAFKAAQFRSIHSARTFSSSSSRAFIQPSTRPTLLRRNIIEQKRSISWNPTSWWPSNNPKPFPETHASAPSTTSSTSTADPALASSAVSPNAVQSAPVTPVDQAASTPAEASSALSNLTDVNIPDSSPIPLATEQIGYLKSLGIEYSYGPTAMIEWLLEHIHVYTGLPWWGSIALTAALIRLSFTPLLMKTSDTQARMSHIQPELNKIQKTMMAAYRAQDTNTVAIARRDMQNLRLRAGVSFRPMIFNVVVNMAFALAALKLMRAMTALPVPGLLNGGALWFTDLTVADPYYALPLLMAGTIHGVFRFNSDPAMQMQNTPGMQTFTLYVLPGLVFFSMIWFSAGLNLWLASAGLVSITVGKIIQRPDFRARFGMMQPPPPGQGGKASMFSMFQEDAEDTSKTIDVTPVNKSSVGGVQYQAPRVKSTSSSATNGANGASNINGRKMNRGRAQGATTVNATASSGSSTATASVVDENDVRPASGPQKGMLERYVNWGSDKINSMGESYASLMKRLRKARGVQDQHEGSTRNKNFLKRAEEYERRYQRRQEMKKGR
ncbi:putative inner membrane protein OXA1 [Elsinoe fawcettii]|nr:putative inner membrane protein OXA1 [Elsinoe fawcettii]